MEITVANWDLIAGLLLGIGLSAACGLRLFIPPLVLSGAGLYFGVPLPEQLQWLATDTAFFILLAATLVEIGAYYVPWLDNLLDNVAAPAAIIAGTLITSPFIGQLDPRMAPILQWTLALIAGGAAAGTVQSLTGATRLGSSVLTGGLANPVLATVENISSLVLSVLAILFPVATVILIGLVLFAAWRLIFNRKGPPERPLLKP